MFKDKGRGPIKGDKDVLLRPSRDPIDHNSLVWGAERFPQKAIITSMLFLKFNLRAVHNVQNDPKHELWNYFKLNKIFLWYFSSLHENQFGMGKSQF